jgi:hypothetical protein
MSHKSTYPFEYTLHKFRPIAFAHEYQFMGYKYGSKKLCGMWNGTWLFKIFVVKLVHTSTNKSSSYPIFVDGFHINRGRMIDA